VGYTLAIFIAVWAAAPLAISATVAKKLTLALTASEPVALSAIATLISRPRFELSAPVAVSATAASIPAELTVGTNNQFLIANSATATGLQWTSTLASPTITSPIVTGLTLNDSSIIFEGATANDFETTLTVTDPTADRTITLPDTTGTVALMSQVINNTLTSTTGDIIYASGANTPARLGIGTEGFVLTVTSGVPAWSASSGGGGSASLPDIFLLGGM
jgi:hypothetical protein